MATTMAGYEESRSTYRRSKNAVTAVKNVAKGKIFSTIFLSDRSTAKTVPTRSNHVVIVSATCPQPNSIKVL